jgi:hypothetical protein
VIHRAHHLQDEQLFDAYLAERGGTLLDPPVADHLTDCGTCSARYSEIALFMDTLRREGETEADEVFGPDRLRVQQQQIARRIAQVGRPARIISFPGRFVRRTIGASTSRTPPRWTAAAAAAALFIAAAAGASYEWGVRTHGQSILRARGASAVRMSPVATDGTSPAEIAADTAFLSDLEVALERPHTRELQAFDALTPHVREIRDQR